jgi:DNA-binding NtrC family response regulator
MDEVGELSPATQAKLLRVLETGEVTRVGSHKARHVDVRVISATNRDLRVLSARGEFRSDLYFRLNGVSVTVPPLRKRPNDILPLAEFFIGRFAHKLSRTPPKLSEAAREALVSHRWPGNVRELKHVLERAVLLCQSDEIDASGLQIDVGFGSRDAEAHSSLEPSSSDKSRLRDSNRDRAPKSSRSLATRFRSSRSRAEHLKSELLRAERERIMDALEQGGTQAAASIPRPRKGREKEEV